MNIIDHLKAGEDLIATPPIMPQKPHWTYTLGGKAVIIRKQDMAAIFRGSRIFMERLAGNRIRYFHRNEEEAKVEKKKRKRSR